MTHMTDLAAISGQVVDIQNDRQHKGYIKITVHVAAEAGPHLTRVLGWPTYTNPVPIGMARLDGTEHLLSSPANAARLMHSIAEADAGNMVEHDPVQQPAKEKAEIATASETGPPARTNRYAQRAGILCNDPRFQGFLLDRYGCQKILDPIQRRDWTVEKVRELCEVRSRAEILPNTPAADRFDILESAYLVENR